MVDNFSFTEGSGKTGAADDIGGVLYPRVKIAQGADGAATDVSSAAPLQVSLANHGANATAVKVDGSAVTQPVSAGSLPLPTGAATSANQDTHNTRIGDVTEVAPATDTASSGLNGRLQRIAQRLTSLIALLPASLGANGGLKIEGVASGTAVPVSVASIPSHPVTNAGTFAVQVDGAALTALQLIDDPVIADDAAFTPTTSKVMMAGFQADETATDSVDEGDAGAARITLDRKVITTEQPHTAGGLSMSKTVSAASTNATVVKASAGKVYAIQASNVNASARYLKLYNKATAPTVGTDTPVKTLIIPGNTAGAGTNIVFPTGIEFATGIAFALTTEATDAGTTAVAANEIVVNIDYK